MAMADRHEGNASQYLTIRRMLIGTISIGSLVASTVNWKEVEYVRPIAWTTLFGLMAVGDGENLN